MMGTAIHAFCWPQSAEVGDPVAVFVSGEGPIDIEVTRIEGGTPELDPVVHSRASVPADPQPVRSDVAQRGCSWAPTAELDTSSWRPGMYLVSATPTTAAVSDPGTTGWAYVVVRGPRPAAPIVLMLATNTWNAYNDWGGANLYTGATAVSFRRPLPDGFLRKPWGAGDRFAQTEPGSRTLADFQTYTGDRAFTVWHGAAGFAGYEERFLRWAADRSIEIDVVLDRDVDADPALLEGYDVAVSVGHDEYTTWAQRDHLDAFVAQGGHLVFLAGNAHYWQVRLADDAMVCFKHRFEDDPLLGDPDPALARQVTTMWSDPILGRPENELTGVSFTRGGYARMGSRVRNGSGAYTIARPEHPLLAGTGLGWGDQLGASSTVVGYECDGCDLTLVEGRPVPTGVDSTPANFEIIATSPVQPFDADSTLAPLPEGGRYELEFHAERLLGRTDADAQRRLEFGHAVFGTWSHHSGGSVVTTGCTDWVFGLDDPMIDRITRNMLRVSPAPSP